MAKFGCLCGETLSNGACPNDVQVHIYILDTWEDAVKNDDDIFDVDEDYDTWMCPTCRRVYSFKNKKVDKGFIIESILTKELDSCEFTLKRANKGRPIVGAR